MKIQEIDLKLIQDNPYQTRDSIKEEPLKILTKSIRERGLFNPITLLKTDEGYFIVNGHRRFNAYKRLKKVSKKYYKIPAIVKERNLNNELVIDLVHENLIREDLTPVEKAKSIKLLIAQIKATEGNVDKIKTLIGLLKNYKRRGYFPEHRKEATKSFNLDHVFEVEKILKSIGISENSAIIYLTLLILPRYIREKIVFSKTKPGAFGNITVKQAEQLCRVKDSKYQEHLFKRSLKGVTCRSLQAMVDMHLKKVDSGEWNGIKQNKLAHKFKEDLELLEEFNNKIRKLSESVASFRVATLIRLDTTLEKEEFDSQMRGLRKEMDLLSNRINEKLIDKGMQPIKEEVDEFEIKVTMAKGKGYYRTTIPKPICRKLNLSEEKPEFLKLKIIGKRGVTFKK